jgi:hypothetical protein
MWGSISNSERDKRTSETGEKGEIDWKCNLHESRLSRMSRPSRSCFTNGADGLFEHLE